MGLFKELGNLMGQAADGAIKIVGGIILQDENSMNKGDVCLC